MAGPGLSLVFPACTGCGRKVTAVNSTWKCANCHGQWAGGAGMSWTYRVALGLARPGSRSELSASLLGAGGDAWFGCTAAQWVEETGRAAAHFRQHGEDEEPWMERLAAQLRALISLCGVVGQFFDMEIRQTAGLRAGERGSGSAAVSYVITRLFPAADSARPLLTIVDMWRQIVSEAARAAGIPAMPQPTSDDTKSSLAGFFSAGSIAAALAPEAALVETPISVDSCEQPPVAVLDSERLLELWALNAAIWGDEDTADQQLTSNSPINTADLLLSWSQFEQSVDDDSRLCHFSQLSQHELCRSGSSDSCVSRITPLVLPSMTPPSRGRCTRQQFTPPDTLMRRFELTPESVARESRAAAAAAAPATRHDSLTVPAILAPETPRAACPANIIAMRAAAFDNFSVRHVLEHRSYPTLRHPVSDSTTVQDALAVMRKYNAVSLPVLGHIPDSSTSRFPLVDVVSVYDLRDYIIHSPELGKEVEFQLISGRPSGDRTVLGDTMAQVIASRKHATQEIDADAPLESLVRLFSTLGHHRVLVTGVSSDSASSFARSVPNSSSITQGRRRRAREWSIGSGCSYASSSLMGGYPECDDDLCDDDDDDEDSDGSTSRMWGLTQHDILHFIQHNNHLLGHAILDTSVSDISSTKPLTATAAQEKRASHLPILTIRDSAVSAMKQLRDSHTSALPVVDVHGRLVTELAGTSVRYLTETKLGLLGKPVLAFLYGLGLSAATPYVIHEHFNLSQILTGLLLRMNTDRAWLVDAEDRPICAISTTDILNHLL
ncbi:hypothetical protein H4R26_000186 [Coemansia thaxteri]|uniref:CBS domain-containing protein n=1 Tax=Coemansia thaxteri TaxID=2663907 RepID=A0A9W8BKM8_9FUNG|nr:hypothetical protein H4R26_000186 [Coemansia thaxteri]